jgi:hypothetical protein
MMGAMKGRADRILLLSLVCNWKILLPFGTLQCRVTISLQHLKEWLKQYNNRLKTSSDAFAGVYFAVVIS